MKIYRPNTRTHVAFVQPANHSKALRNSDFVNEDGSPKMFQIQFVNGQAEVPSNLGQYMIDTEQARKTALILPDRMAA